MGTDQPKTILESSAIANRLAQYESGLDNTERCEVQSLLYSDGLGLVDKLRKQLKKGKDSDFKKFLNENKETSLITKFNKVKKSNLNTGIDGVFGSSTRLTIAFFQWEQTNNSGKVDGVWGPETADLMKVFYDTNRGIENLATNIIPLSSNAVYTFSETKLKGEIKAGEKLALNDQIIEKDAYTTTKKILATVPKETEKEVAKQIREKGGNKAYLKSLDSSNKAQTAVLKEIKKTETARANAAFKMFENSCAVIEKIDNPKDGELLTLFTQLEGFEEMVRHNVDGKGLFEPAAWMQATVNVFSKKSNKTKTEIATLLKNKLNFKKVAEMNTQKKNVLQALEASDVPVEMQTPGLKNELIMMALFGYLTIFNLKLWQNGVRAGENRKEVANLINWIKTTDGKEPFVDPDLDPDNPYGDNLEDLVKRDIAELQKLETANTFLLQYGTVEQQASAKEKLNTLTRYKTTILKSFITKYGKTAEIARKQLFNWRERLFLNREENGNAKDSLKVIYDPKIKIDKRIAAIQSLNTILSKELKEDVNQKTERLADIGRSLTGREGRALNRVLKTEKTYDRIKFENDEVWVWGKEKEKGSPNLKIKITDSLYKIKADKSKSLKNLRDLLNKFKVTGKNEINSQKTNLDIANQKLASHYLSFDSTQDWKKLSVEYQRQLKSIAKMVDELGIKGMEKKRLLGVLGRFKNLHSASVRYPMPQSVFSNLSKSLKTNENIKKWLTAVAHPETYWTYYTENVLPKEDLNKLKQFENKDTYNGRGIDYVHSKPIIKETTFKNLQTDSPDGEKSSLYHILGGIGEHYKLYLTPAEFEKAFSEREPITLGDKALNVLNTSRENFDDHDGYTLKAGDEVLKMPYTKEYQILGSDNKYHNIKINYKIYLKSKCGNPIVVPEFVTFSNSTELIPLTGLTLDGISAIATRKGIPIGWQVWDGIIGKMFKKKPKKKKEEPKKPDPVEPDPVKPPIKPPVKPPIKPPVKPPIKPPVKIPPAPLKKAPPTGDPSSGVVREITNIPESPTGDVIATTPAVPNVDGAITGL